jgi:hypothetical protein
MNSIAGPPSSTTESAARCISRDGLVLGGWSGYSGGGTLTKPVIWKDPVTVVTLPFPPGASVNTGEVHALSADGSVAAGSVWQQSNPGGTARAFIWDATNGTRDLRSALVAKGVDLAGWTLQDVTAVSSDGTMMCGNGLYNGVARGWVFAFSSLQPLMPLVLRHPVPQTMGWGESATFEVEAMGALPLAYRWQHNGVDLEDGLHYQGSDSPTLTVLGVRVELEGQYRCRISNEQGQASSHTADLRLLTTKPDFDRDGDVDQEDYGLLQSCFSGSTVPQNAPRCAPTLLDGDGDVDHNDLVIFLRCMSGANNLALLGCEDL